MTEQFSRRGMARGTKLTLQHVADPLQSIQTALEDSTVENLTEGLAPLRITHVVPYVDSRLGGNGTWYLPFVCPPLQDEWRPTQQPPPYQAVIRDLSISFDQRGAPNAITDRNNVAVQGWLTDSADRLTLRVRLLELPLTVNDPNPTHSRVIYDVTLPGFEAFGNPFYRANPAPLNDLRIPLNPYKAYAWECIADQMLTGDPTKDNLALPNLLISASGTYPLLSRDVNIGTQINPTVQNQPMNKGLPATGGMFYAPPLGNAPIDGDTDLQTGFQTFDQVLLNKLRSGYGSDVGGHKDLGNESARYPWEHLSKDACYSVIVVPLWNVTQDIRAGDTDVNFLPYVEAEPGPYKDPTADRRLVRIPTGFVLHHAVASWGLSSPVTTTHPNPAEFWADQHFVNRIGIGICNGLRGDDYSYQQVAYLAWSGINYSTYQIASYADSLTACPEFVLMHVPLDNPLAPAWEDKSYMDSGPPFYMGGGNNNVSNRSYASSAPTAFGGGAFHAPYTQGGENFLEVRWTIQNSVEGLEDPAHPEYVINGTVGNYIILVGKQTLSA